MDDARHSELMADQALQLTTAEIADGWHWCGDFDGLLVGPGMGEMALCQCRVHGCWTDQPLPHPWEPRITDVACGYDDRMTEPKCAGCHRQRAESPLDQLRAIDARHGEDGIG